MPGQPSAIWGRVKRTIRHPIMGVLIAIVLCVDIYHLPAPRPYSRGGSLVRALVTIPFSGTISYSHLELVATKTDQGWDVLDGMNSRDAILQLDYSPEIKQVECLLFGGGKTSRAGLWAPIVETITYNLRITSTGDLTHGEIQSARLAICAHIQSLAIQESDPYLADLATLASVRNTSVTKVLWPGVAHTVLALVLLCSLVYAWHDAPSRLRSFYGTTKADRRRARGLCVHCCYDLSGLEDSAICPECGAATTRPLEAGPCA